MIKTQLAIIGGGAAGLAAALSAYESGVKDIIILERDKEPGGILNQCIHNGFGLSTFKEELSGPSYAERFINEVGKTDIKIMLETMVLSMNKNRTIEIVSPVTGYEQIQADAIILAMGCRERTRGAIAIPGTRPAGIYSAGTAQRYLNIEGYLCGKRVFILGSGDIGLIMARRMTLEGAKVLGVAEVMPYSNGLPRNMKQCLDDFDIPLYLSHTIVDIQGDKRVTGITIAQVDEHRKPISGTEKQFDCDSVLFSVGLIPENNLSEDAGVLLDRVTKGPVVNNQYMTSVEGIFACGNVLHVHDLVDEVSKESKRCGKACADWLCNGNTSNIRINCKAGNKVGYVVPQRIDIRNENIPLLFRVKEPMRDKKLVVKLDGEIIRTINKYLLNPSVMEEIMMDGSTLKEGSELIVEVAK